MAGGEQLRWINAGFDCLQLFEDGRIVESAAPARGALVQIDVVKVGEPGCQRALEHCDMGINLFGCGGVGGDAD